MIYSTIRAEERGCSINSPYRTRALRSEWPRPSITVFKGSSFVLKTTARRGNGNFEKTHEESMK
jgi:hypothetical protein